jgi:regulator of replication initiation timing
MVGQDPYGSPSAIGARTTRPQDLKWVADPNNARSYEEMKQAASTVESQVNQLKLVVHKALGGGDFDAALKARKELEGEWWDTKEQMESHKIVSYQQADVYIKRAASRMSTHRKWYATQNKRANKTIEDALEELRLASLVLQQKQTEEEQSAEALAKASAELTKSVRAEAAAVQRLRADLDPIVAAVTAEMERLGTDLTRWSASRAGKTHVVATVEQRMDAPVATPVRRDPAPPIVPASPAPQAARVAPDSAPVEPQVIVKEVVKYVDRIVEREVPVERSVESADSDVERRRLADDLRRVTARCAALDDECADARAAHRRDAAKLAEQIESLRDALSRESASTSVLKAEAEKWRAMYDAVRDDASNDSQARAEADALRMSVQHAEDRHRRELMLLGTEHGNAYAALRKSVAAAEKRCADLESQVEAAEKRCGEEEKRRREADDTRAELERQLRLLQADTRTNADRAMSSARDLMDQLSSADARIRVLQDQKEELAKKLAEMEETNTKLLGQNSGSDWRLIAAEAKLKQTADHLASEQQETSRLNAEIDKLTEQVRLARDTARASATNDLPGVIAGLEAEIATLQKKHQLALDQEKELAGAEAERVKLLHEAEVRKLTSLQEAEQLRLTELDRRTAELLATEKEIRASTEEEAKRLRADKEALREELSQIKDDLRGAKADLTSLEKALRDSVEQNEELREKNEELRAQKAKVQERVVEVPGPERVVTKEVIKEVEVPGPERIVTKEVVKEVPVPGPERVVTKEVIKEVPVEGPERVVTKEIIVEVPTPTATPPASPAPKTAAPAPASPDPALVKQIEAQATKIGRLEAELAAVEEAKRATEEERARALKDAELSKAALESAKEAALAKEKERADAEEAAEKARAQQPVAQQPVAEVASAAPALAVMHASSQPQTPKQPTRPSTPGPGGLDDEQVEYLRYQYSAASDNLAVLALLVQEAAAQHLWVDGPGRDKKPLKFGQPHGPMARTAGRFIVNFIYPRAFVFLWWEVAMFVAAVWFACILGYAYFHGTGMGNHPAVLLSPFIPSFVALTARTYKYCRVDKETFSRDAPRFLIDALHLACFPLGFILIFCKLWDDQGDIPWWLVIFFPWLAMTRILVETMHDVVVKMPLTEFGQLGYGADGTAYEYAFSDPGNDDLDVVEAVGKSPSAARALDMDVVPPMPPPPPPPHPNATPQLSASATSFTPGGGSRGASRPGSRGRDFGSFLRTSRSNGHEQFTDIGGPGGGVAVSDEGVRMMNVPSPREYAAEGDQRV